MEFEKETKFHAGGKEWSFKTDPIFRPPWAEDRLLRQTQTAAKAFLFSALSGRYLPLPVFNIELSQKSLWSCISPKGCLNFSHNTKFIKSPKIWS
jgi:hypothetical protein